MMEGRAKTWFNINRDRFLTYEEFEVAFLDEIYSMPIQVRIRNQWRNRRYNRGDKSMLSFFMNKLEMRNI